MALLFKDLWFNPPTMGTKRRKTLLTINIGAAFAGDDATDESGQGGQVPGALPLGLTRIPLWQGSPYGTILAEIVTHHRLLLF